MSLADIKKTRFGKQCAFHDLRSLISTFHLVDSSSIAAAAMVRGLLIGRKLCELRLLTLTLTLKRLVELEILRKCVLLFALLSILIVSIVTVAQVYFTVSNNVSAKLG